MSWLWNSNTKQPPPPLQILIPLVSPFGQHNSNVWYHCVGVIFLLLTSFLSLLSFFLLLKIQNSMVKTNKQTNKSLKCPRISLKLKTGSCLSSFPVIPMNIYKYPIHRGNSWRMTGSGVWFQNLITVKNFQSLMMYASVITAEEMRDCLRREGQQQSHYGALGIENNVLLNWKTDLTNSIRISPTRQNSEFTYEQTEQQPKLTDSVGFTGITALYFSNLDQKIPHLYREALSRSMTRAG